MAYGRRRSFRRSRRSFRRRGRVGRMRRSYRVSRGGIRM